jgi:hypothetical protein
MGKIPDDLPDTDIPLTTGAWLAALPAVEEEPNSDTDLRVNRASPANARRDYTPPHLLPVLPSPTTDSGLSQHDPVTVKNDIPALDHFPVPPDHFPLPHLQRVSASPLDGPVGNPPPHGRPAAFPVLLTQEPPALAATTPTELPAATTQILSATNAWANISADSSALSRADPNQTPSQTDLPTTALTTDNTEFGIRQPHHSPPSGSPGSSSLPKESSRSSSVVLAMRNRFAQNVSYDRCACVVLKAQLRSLYLQFPQGNLQLRSRVYRSACQPSQVVINQVVSTLHCARTGLRWGQPLNLHSTMRPPPIHRCVFRRASISCIF